MFIQCRLQAKTNDEFAQSLNSKACHLQLMVDGRVGVMNMPTYMAGDVAIYKPMTKEDVLINFEIEKHHDKSETYDGRFSFFLDKLKQPFL